MNGPYLPLRLTSSEPHHGRTSLGFRRGLCSFTRRRLKGAESSPSLRGCSWLLGIAKSFISKDSTNSLKQFVETYSKMLHVIE